VTHHRRTRFSPGRVARHPHAVRIALAAALACATGPAAAAQPAPPDRGADAPAAAAWVHEAWSVQDGLPVNSITAVLQGRDGYL
jgi:hypothetical protein